MPEKDRKSGKDIQYDYYLFAFIDVLGQKDAFKELENVNLEDNHPKLIEVHKTTAMFVEHLREAFKSFFGALTNREPSIQVHPSKQQQFKDMMQTELRLQSFSDCIQAYVSLHTEKYHCNAVNGVFGVLVACGGMLQLALSLKKPFRAGIQVGIGTELKNGELYGSVVYSAYELESKIAQYPRIVIGEKLLEYLGEVADGQRQIEDQTNEDMEICKSTAKRCLDMIMIDSDGIATLDYLSKEFLSNVYENLDDVEKKNYEATFRDAFKYVQEEYESRKQRGDQKLAQRYFLLLNYFQTRNPFPGIAN